MSVARFTYASQCDGKKSFDTYADAHEATKRFRKQPKVYHCPHCHKYHTGTPLRLTRPRPDEGDWRQELLSTQGD